MNSGGEIPMRLPEEAPELDEVEVPKANVPALEAMPRRSRLAYYSVVRRGGSPSEGMEAAELARTRAR
jgi:hypothetical protein